MKEAVAARTINTEDVEGLFVAHERALRRIVRREVRAPEAVIEDACQTAWTRLISRPGTVQHEASLPWLVTTARREAIRSARGADRFVPLEELSEEASRVPVAPAPEETVELQDRLGQIRDLPRRQQQLVWLHGLGLNYEEMARHSGITRRTVERQLLRAKHALREM